jgi:hypothetical protein
MNTFHRVNVLFCYNSLKTKDEKFSSLKVNHLENELGFFALKFSEKSKCGIFID